MAALLKIPNNEPINLENNNEFTIGRMDHNNVVIRDNNISRTHCLFKKLDGGQWLIQDKSMNGLLVNNFKLVKQRYYVLNNDDIITLTSNYKYKFVNPNAPPSASSHPQFESTKNFTNEMLPEVIDANDFKENMVKETTSNSQADQSLFGGLNEELTCSICSELFVSAVSLQCVHTFCKLCIEQWEETSNTCPICRVKIEQQASNYILDNIINKIIMKLPEDQRKAREEVVASHATRLKSKSGPSRRGRSRRGRQGPIRGRNSRGNRQQAEVSVIDISSDSSGSDLDISEWSTIFTHILEHSFAHLESRTRRRCGRCRTVGHTVRQCPYRE